MSSKTFHIAEVLSVATGAMVANSLERVQELLEHLTGRGAPHDRWHEIIGTARATLARRLPWLKEVPAPKEDLAAWVSSCALDHGEWHEVESS